MFDITGITVEAVSHLFTDEKLNIKASELKRGACQVSIVDEYSIDPFR